MMKDYQKLWEPHVLQPGQTLEVCLGALHLWIHRGNEEWYIAHETDADSEERCSIAVFSAERVADRPWTRWVLHEDIDCVRLRPLLPDRPVIVRPEMPICLMQKESIQFFIGIPIWIAVSFGLNNEPVVEIPTLRLSNSWFGTVTEGELCYAMKTTALRYADDLLPAAYRAVFPLEIRNISNEKLNFQRLCLRSQHLNVYQGNLRLWTSSGRVSFRGEEKWSRIVYSRNAPPMGQAGKLLGEARSPIPRGVLLNTFDSLKQLAEL